MRNDVVVPLDGSLLADSVIPHAAELARRTGGALHLVHVYAPIAPAGGTDDAVTIDPRFDERFERATREWLAQRASEVESTTGVPTTAEVRVGRAVDEIVEVAAWRSADLVCCATHASGGWSPTWMGSVAEGLVRHAPCPVIAISHLASQRSPAIHRILVPLDGSAASGTILGAATRLAKAFGASLTLMRAIPPVPWVGNALGGATVEGVDPFDIDAFAHAAKEDLGVLAADIRAREGLDVRSIIEIHGSPVRAILDTVHDLNPDVIAMATYGRGLSRLVVGGVTDKVIRSGVRSVLCVHPPRGTKYAVRPRVAVGRRPTRIAPSPD